MKKTYLLLFAISTFVALPASAHHAATAFFGGEVVRIEGRLNGARIVNPHSYFRVTTDEDVDWVIESQQSGTQLFAMGFTEELFVKDQRVVVTGDSNRDGRPQARWRTVAFLGEQGGDPAEVYFVGRIPKEPWADAVRELSEPCSTGIKQCFRLSADDMANIDASHGNGHLLW